MSTDLYLVRHAQDGPTGEGSRRLTELGQDQARDLGTWLAGLAVDALLSSDLPRARETADLMLAGLATPPPRSYEPRLREVEGSPSDLPPRLRRRPDGGDSWTSFVRGVGDVVGDATRQYAGGRVILVCHSGVFDAVLEIATSSRGRAEVSVDPAGVSHWRFRPGCPEGEWLLLGHNLHPSGGRA